MTIDKEEHRALLLQLIEAASFPGQHIELAVEIKRAIQTATLPALPKAK